MALSRWQRQLLLLALCGVAFWFYMDSRGPARAPGVLAPNAPVQSALAPGAKPFELRGYRITPLAAITLEARVIASQRYFSGREAELSALDLVLGWGRMSDSDMLVRVDFAQNDRRYVWHAYDPAIADDEIKTHTANLHVIPATAELDAKLKSLRPGHLAQLQGLLVEARAADGWKWGSSLAQAAGAAPADELVWVERLDAR